MAAKASERRSPADRGSSSHNGGRDRLEPLFQQGAVGGQQPPEHRHRPRLILAGADGDVAVAGASLDCDDRAGVVLVHQRV